METLSLQNKYELKELELNALLEVTQAINNNLTEEALYKIYNFTLRANLNLRKLALYVLDEEWVCKVNFGTEGDFSGIPLTEEFLPLRKATLLAASETPFAEFDHVVPVAHKSNLLAFVFVGGLYSHTDEELSRNGINFIQALSNIIMVAIENKKLARKQLSQEALRKELEIANQVQKYLIPKTLPSTDTLQIAAKYQPHDQVGGDYYDYLELPNGQFILCIADVSGKGIPAALLMSNFQASLRTLARKTNDLEEIIEVLNSQTYASANGENFITFFLCLYTPSLQRLEYINAGHNPPLLKVGQELTWLEEGTTILGGFPKLPFVNKAVIEGVSDFLIVLYTDGVTEVFNRDDVPYGPERLLSFFTRCHQKDLDDLNESLVEELDTFRENVAYGDDVTLVTCRYLG